MNDDAKKVTITDVADLAEVSVATVSRVLNNRHHVKPDTRSRVVEAMKTLGYEPDASRPPARSGGMIIMNIPSLSNPFYSEIVKGAKTSANRHGFDLLVDQDYLGDDGQARLLDLVANTKTAGTIVTDSVPAAFLDQLAQTAPVMQCCEYVEHSAHSYVGVDDFAAAKRAVEALIAAGRRRIALLNGPLRYKYALHRRQGYLEALRHANLPLRDEWIVQIPDIDFGIALSAAASQLGGSTPPDAYLAASDVLAAAVIRAARQVGMRVPEDVMVFGFDNVDIAVATSPTITTVSLPKFQLGYTACELLVDKIRNPAIPPQQVLLGTEMIMRESTAPQR